MSSSRKNRRDRGGGLRFRQRLAAKQRKLVYSVRPVVAYGGNKHLFAFFAGCQSKLNACGKARRYIGCAAVKVRCAVGKRKFGRYGWRQHTAAAACKNKRPAVRKSQCRSCCRYAVFASFKCHAAQIGVNLGFYKQIRIAFVNVKIIYRKKLRFCKKQQFVKTALPRSVGYFYGGIYPRR